ncbi:hypothetical protein MFLO_14747 [Listeria floridensis FSL S10-1187]|uniref:DUF4352 domain-containing protein n=1 Tax=Listeria floridensis FSL S10-1187 TaxID=1265817 RepID=A0ABP3AU67_9LIST|nr:hypothetical protein MFLO_14747 [Listeria floridensis FSL S10-1187]
MRNLKQKKLKLEDVEKIKVGISKDELLEKLGKPLKIWDDDYVYEELDSSVTRNEYFYKYIDKSEEKIKQGKQAKEMKSLKMYQYTYSNDSGDDETFLAWMGTDDVKYTDMRAFMDKDGYSADDNGDEGESDSSDYNNADDETTESGIFTIGESAHYANGQIMTITSIKNAQNEKDDYTEISQNLVKVEFTIDNQTSETLDFDSTMIELYDGERNKAEVLSKDFYSETIAAGMKSSGKAYFDAGKAPYTVIIGAAKWEE